MILVTILNGIPILTKYLDQSLILQPAERAELPAKCECKSESLASLPEYSCIDQEACKSMADEMTVYLATPIGDRVLEHKSREGGSISMTLVASSTVRNLDFKLHIFSHPTFKSFHNRQGWLQTKGYTLYPMISNKSFVLGIPILKTCSKAFNPLMLKSYS